MSKRPLQRLLSLLLLPPALLATCASVFQGPLFGSITLQRTSDAGDAVAFLRCRGPGLHGSVQTDAEHSRVGTDARFSFGGSFTFPTTDRCYIQIRHPRYLTARADLTDALVQKLQPITLQSWSEFYRAGPEHEINPGKGQPWPATELRRHLSDTRMWLDSFPKREQHRMARYVPDIHHIYSQAQARLLYKNTGLSDMLKMIARIEATTAYPYPFKDYIKAVEAGDAAKVAAFIAGGVLRATVYQGHNSMLYLAASEGYLEVMDVLLANDEPLDITGCGAPLLGAIAQQQWPAAVKLLRAGADINTGCRSNHVTVGDALSNFARRGKIDMLREFLDASVPVDTRNSRGTTALVEAASAGSIEAVKILLAAGANPKERSADNTTLLAHAGDKGLLDVQRELEWAMAGSKPTQAPPPATGKTVSLPWRLGDAQPYRVHTNFSWVNNMAADPGEPGVLWLATAGGLVRAAPATGKRQTWTRADGLPSSSVQHLWFDDDGDYLWLATGGRLARLAMPEPDRIEIMGDNKLPSSFSRGFLQSDLSARPWVWGAAGMYQLDVENSSAQHYALPENLVGAASIADSADFFVGDNTTLWRFNAETGEPTLVLEAKALGSLTPQGPSGDPELRSLTADSDNGYLWIDSRRHGVFRMDMASGSVERPRLTPEQVAQCARTTVTPHMEGHTARAAGQTFVQLERCFGRIDEDNRYEVLRPRIVAGPIADARGDIWYIADHNFYRMDANSTQMQFPRAADPLNYAQARLIDITGDQLVVRVGRGAASILDLKTRSWSTAAKAVSKKKPARRASHKADDPDAPQLSWHVLDSGIYLNSGGRQVHQWPAKLRRGDIKVTRNGSTTVWVATADGLIEFPIGESLDELLALASAANKPQQPSEQSGRGPR